MFALCFANTCGGLTPSTEDQLNLWTDEAIAFALIA
jgi:hypothetical protein